MPTETDVRAIAKTLPIYNDIKQGNVEGQCAPFARELRNALQAMGIPTIMVGGDANINKIEQNYLYCKLDEGIRLVDPTAAMYLPSLKGDVYVGTREELHRIGHEYDPATNWNKIWSDKPFLWKRGGERYEGARKTEFLEKWGGTGVVIDAPNMKTQRGG